MTNIEKLYNFGNEEKNGSMAIAQLEVWDKQDILIHERGYKKKGKTPASS